MKKSFLFIPAALLLSFAGCDNKQTSAEHQDATPMATDTVAVTGSATTSENAVPMDSAAQAKAWEEYMTPGDMHKWLSSTDGKWEAEFTFWQGPEASPQSGAKARAEFKTILGGKYQEQVYKGDMFGMPFEGRGLTGFDNAKKKFVSTWIDNMGTGMMFMEGEYDEGSKTLVCTGKSIDPLTHKEVEMREVLKVIDDKHQVMEMYDKKNGTEYKSMEIKLTKK